MTHPEDELDVGSVPAVAKVVGKETPWVVVVFIGEQNTDAAIALLVDGVVVSPDYAKIERTGRSHDSDVGKKPFAVIVGERVDGLEEEWVAGNSAHDIVGDTGRVCATDPSWIREKRVKTTIATIVEIDVNATKVVQDEVSYSIGTLDGIRVAVESLEKPWVFSGDELTRLLVGPKLVFIIRV